MRVLCELSSRETVEGSANGEEMIRASAAGSPALIGKVFVNI